METTSRGSPTRPAAGIRAGIDATLAMSLFMLIAQRAGFRAEQPPKRIVEHVFDVAGLSRDRHVDDAVAVVAHLSYGAALGASYDAWSPGAGRLRGGVSFGLAVWAASYLGWIPLAGIMPPPHRDDPGRQVTMVLAHVLFGTVLSRRLRSHHRRLRGSGH